MTFAGPVYFILPGALDTPTGGFLYDKRIIEGLRARGVAVAIQELGGRYPVPDAAARRAAGVCFSALPDGALTVVDGLAGGVLPDVLGAVSKRLRLVGLVHHPLCEETGLSEEEKTDFFRSEKAALGAFRRVVTTSETTADTLRRDFGFAGAAIDVVPPGTEPATLAEGSGGDECHILCVATLIPRKGHEVLLKALEDLPSSGWRVTCVGSDALDPAHAERIYEIWRRHPRADLISFTGAVEFEELENRYAWADLLVLPSYYEGFGMVVTEAVARGLPVLAAAGGAVPATLPEGAGILVPPGDAGALGRALARLVTSRKQLAALRDGARQARGSLIGWDESAALFEQALKRAA